MTQDRATAGDIAAQLADRIEPLVMALTGDQPTGRTRTQIRYGGKQGLCVEIAGSKRGIWCDFRDGNKGGDPIDLVRHLLRCSLPDALTWSRAWLGQPDDAPSPRSTPPVAAHRNDDDDTRRNFELALAIWRESVAPVGTPVEKYLTGRGLELPPSGVLRYHAACPCGTGRRPAMIAAMTDAMTRGPKGIHRTFLDTEGNKAVMDVPKKMLGPAGIIRLSDDEEVTTGLGLVEGIENGLTILQIAGWFPVWAAGSAGGIAGFTVLAGIEALTIFADADDPGMKAARACAARWAEAGREVQIIPPRKGDWNDAIKARAA